VASLLAGVEQVLEELAAHGLEQTLAMADRLSLRITLTKE
jgi:hypothetical protein